MATQSVYPRSQLLLPLWKGVVFVDWNGVLSNDVFWSSIRLSPRRKFHKRLIAAADSLFRNTERVEAWMRGHVRSEEIVCELGVPLDRCCRDDYLLRRLRDDCRRMKCNQVLVDELARVGGTALIVLATDNMDCFAEQVHSIGELGGLFDDVLCSSVLGTLKSDSVDRFFGPWLRRNRLSFRQALLLDDSPSTCSHFQYAGGTAVHITSIDDAVAGLREWITGLDNTISRMFQ